MKFIIKVFLATFFLVCILFPIPSFAETDYASYPIVDSIEQKVFNKTFQQDDILNRLDRLEIHLFKQKSDASLNDRVDILSAKVLQKRNNDDDDLKLSSIRNIDDIELKVFDRTYSQYPLKERLSILEDKLFKQEFNEDSDEARLEKISLAIEPQKPSFSNNTQIPPNDYLNKLNSNRFSYNTGNNLPKNKFTQYLPSGPELGGLLIMLLSLLI